MFSFCDIYWFFISNLISDFVVYIFNQHKIFNFLRKGAHTYTNKTSNYFKMFNETLQPKWANI